MKDEISSAGNLIKIIEDSRNNALKRVNEELIQMYWKVGEYLSKEAESAAFGDAYIDSVVKEIQEAFPGIKGFNRRGLYRMKKFYETYCDDEFVTTLLTQISWSNHLAIMSKAKTAEERHFYITLCIKEAYSARELDRQINSGYYERYMQKKKCALTEQTMFLLNRAKDNLANSYIGKVERGFKYYSDTLMEKGIGKVMVDNNLHLHIDEKGAAREVGSFSAGMIDCIVLCMRLALVDALFGEEKPFLILDDPFVNLDDKHTKRAREMLDKIAQDHQLRICIMILQDSYGALKTLLLLGIDVSTRLWMMI